ncbi:oligopeptidase A [Beggiatoa leptomitoformis]|uniref:oligopeptidase A n=1 Tax=Beggiatoa leptomitoformis TaxID=288004 RepID=A0A2N9YA48_9GAMM|nr:oligopeptidase A [Beggiatoa leptomitoformis]ALG69346.1 oligopeptidase A [Beggiatoa leptomitoformis]AUI67330.1 oligopeptidase A [Beggiatoa leptomitoformis]
MDNPLLNYETLPKFSQIKPEHVEPALTNVLNRNLADIQHLLDTAKPYTWDSLIAPLNELNDRLNKTWSPVGHLNSVLDSEALRKVYNECLPKLSLYSSEIGQNKTLYEAYKSIADSAEFAKLEPAQQKVITNELRDFRLSGIHLPPEQQARCKDIRQQLSQLNAKFSQNLLDATHAWKKQITDENVLAGLPDSLKSLARQNAEQANLDGWLLTLDLPCYMPVMNYADNRELRHEMYVAYVTRASANSEFSAQFDNTTLIDEILALRHELAQLLGFHTYTEQSLFNNRMAKTPKQVIDFIYDLAYRSRPLAEGELAELRAFTAAQYKMPTLEMWDIPYYSEKLRHLRYELSQETLRPYFPLPNVLQGLFQVVKRLFGLDIQTKADVDTWHPNVQFFEIFDSANELRGQFYLDPYARQGKRGGAWMDECIARKRLVSGVQTPVAHLVCNFPPPVGDNPSLLTHNDVLTLFHEFGHGLHHMLTKVDYSPVSGINGVSWDAVELPSQLLENWCWEREALDLFASHYQTGEKLPSDLLDKMLAAKNFQAGLFMLRQLEFSLFDLRIHTDYTAEMNVQATLDAVRQQIAVLVPPAFNRFQNSFSHIFAGGYAAGYYSYKWAEVLSADVFSKFEENGIFDRKTGEAFLHSVLERGGSQDAMTLFVEFRGRQPKIEPLLKQCGLLAA